jgi:hypothetical protein
MQKLANIIIVAIGSLLLAAPALACSKCVTPADTAACCSKRVFEISKILKHRVHCEFPAHRCALPFSVDRELCLAAPCHLPPVICDIDRVICLEPPCHMPAIALKPVECCSCGIELTGSKDLIVQCESCSNGK